MSATHLFTGRLRPLLFIIIFFANVTLVEAQKLSSFRVAVESRYDNLDWGKENNRIQSAIRGWATIDFGAGFSSVVHTSTGNRFQSRWSTATDFEPPREDEFMMMYVRQLYAQYENEKWRIQVGTIPPVKNIASRTGLEPSGWVDGVRVVRNFSDRLLVEAVVGGIDRLNEPNAFTRPKVLNFAEIEVSAELTQKFAAEFSSEYLDNQGYLRWELTFDDGKMRPSIKPEMMYNLTQNSFAYGISMEQDLNEFFPGRENQGVRVRLFYSYIDPQIGLRGILSDDFYAFGHAFTVELDGPVWREASINWFARQIFMSPSRSTIGLRMNLRRE